MTLEFNVLGTLDPVSGVLRVPNALQPAGQLSKRHLCLQATNYCPPLALLLLSIRGLLVTRAGNGLEAIRLSQLRKVRSCLLGEKPTL